MPANDWTVGQEWSAVREHCGAHTQAVLSDDTLCGLYLESFDQQTARLQLSDRPLLREVSPFTTADQDFPLSAIERNAIVNGFSRRPIGSTNESDWRDVPITSIDDLAFDLERGVPSVAIYDTPARATFSYDPSDYEHRVVYIRTVTRPTIQDETPEHNTIFSSHRIFLTAQQALPLCLKNAPDDYPAQVYSAMERAIKAGMDRWDSLFQQWADHEPQRGPAQRPKFNAGRSPHRFRSGMISTGDN